MLLERGADPDRPAAGGTTPLQVAAMRGNAGVAEMLLARGADPQVCDRYGLTAADWARRNGHSALARRLLPGGAAGPEEQQPDTPGVSSLEQVLFTGIKAVDLFCPIPRGGLVRVPFMAGVGMLVLIGELCERMVRMPGGAALWTGFAQRPFDVADWRADMAELGILERVEFRMADLDASARQRREAFQQGMTRACRLRAQGGHVLLVLLSDEGINCTCLNNRTHNPIVWHIICPYQIKIIYDTT
jgi:hypothetical protein